MTTLTNEYRSSSGNRLPAYPPAPRSRLWRSMCVCSRGPPHWRCIAPLVNSNRACPLVCPSIEASFAARCSMVHPAQLSAALRHPPAPLVPIPSSAPKPCPSSAITAAHSLGWQQCIANPSVLSCACASSLPTTENPSAASGNGPARDRLQPAQSIAAAPMQPASSAGPLMSGQAPGPKQPVHASKPSVQ